MKKSNKPKLGTVLTAIACVASAVLFWLFAKYLESDAAAVKLCIDSAFGLL